MTDATKQKISLLVDKHQLFLLVDRDGNHIFSVDEDGTVMHMGKKVKMVLSEQSNVPNVLGVETREAPMPVDPVLIRIANEFKRRRGPTIADGVYSAEAINIYRECYINALSKIYEEVTMYKILPPDLEILLKLCLPGNVTCQPTSTDVQTASTN